jgi:hypothetical protein
MLLMKLFTRIGEIKMDPVTITAVASSVLSMLLPYIQKAGDKFAEEIGKSIPEYIGKLYDAIKRRFETKPIAIETVNELEKKPDDPDLQEAFAGQLKMFLNEDDLFAKEINDLLRLKGQSTVINIAQTGSGSAATNEGVAAGEKGLAVKGDIHGNITMNKS